MNPYPHHLLPKVYYKKIPFKAIPLNAHFLRFIDEDLQITTKDELLNNCENIINPSRFPNGCSMNILSIFTKEDVKYKLEQTDTPIYESWQEGQKCYIPKDEEVCIIENRKFFGIDYSKILKYQAIIEYIDKSSQCKKGGIMSYVFIHAPIMTNFWHFNMYMQISSIAEGKTITCKHQNPDISDSQIKKIVVAQIDDFKDFLLMPSEMKSCKIKRRNYYSAKSIYRYIKSIIHAGCFICANRNNTEM